MDQPRRRQQFTTTVLANLPLCRDHHRLVLGLPIFPPTEPGQFVQVSCRDLDTHFSLDHEAEWREDRPLDARGIELMSPLAMLRRPFSLAGRRDTSRGVELDVIHRVVGVGTDWLAKLRVGDLVHVLGPLGNTFSLPGPGGIAVMVGGGVGIPPMIYLAEALSRAERKGVAFCGALTRDLLALTVTDGAPVPTVDSTDPLYNIEEFSRHGIGAVVTTDDGSYGFQGYVTQALERYLDAYLTDSADRARAVVYTCGPEQMMRRVADIAATRDIDCQVAVERAMACGMGTCQSCCIKVRKPDPSKVPLPGKEWCYRLACTDGPVFRGVDLLW